MRAAPKTIAPADRKALQRQLKLEADSGRVIPLRNRALFLLTWSSALRLSEVLALSIGQVLDVATVAAPRSLAGKVRWRVRSSTYVKVSQAKGGKVVDANGRGASVRTWTSAGTVVIPARARRAIGAYVRAAVKVGALQLAAGDAPLWVQPSTGRQLQPRTIQYQWTGLQRRAGCSELYHFHCLRHDALTRFAAACGGQVFQVAAFGRCDPYTAQRYVHVEPRRLAAFADKAESL
ncbi:MAG TPA: site-specific integrase [Polyangiales bacterium]|nr:site-specific integrase [Polyangiales bacterium]